MTAYKAYVAKCFLHFLVTCDCDYGTTIKFGIPGRIRDSIDSMIINVK
jgi:hypothetical protein